MSQRQASFRLGVAKRPRRSLQLWWLKVDYLTPGDGGLPLPASEWTSLTSAGLEKKRKQWDAGMVALWRGRHLPSLAVLSFSLAAWLMSTRNVPEAEEYISALITDVKLTIIKKNLKKSAKTCQDACETLLSCILTAFFLLMYEADYNTSIHFSSAGVKNKLSVSGGYLVISFRLARVHI